MDFEKRTQLNPEQLEAASVGNGTFIVVAGCGSGKTLTMTHRIGNLVNNGVAPESILGLTFTRNAAQSMRDRLIPVLEDKASRVMLSTMHSFCHSILRNEGIAFEVLSDRDQMAFLRKIMKGLRLNDLALGTVIREISLAKNNLIPCEDFKDIYAGDATMLKIGKVFEEYERQKDHKLLLDFDDLLIRAMELLKDKESVRDKYRGIFRHIMVDEFQDTNPLQMEIVRLLLDDEEPDASFWVCGDDWQSIYAFTGASIGNILNFGVTFPGSRQFVLSVNYRSTPQILQACQNLIRHNQRKIDKTLTASRSEGEDVIVLECSSEEEEAILVVSEVMALIDRHDIGLEDIAVLYRANFQSMTLEEAFAKQKIPYRIEKGQGFYQRKEVKWLLDYLTLIDSPESDAGDEALRSIINVPNRYLGRKFLSELEAFCDQRGVRLYQGLRERPVDRSYLRKNVHDLVGFLDALMAGKDSMGPSEIIGLIRETLDYDRYVTDEDIPSPDDQKLQNVNHLQLSAVRFERIAPFLEHVASFQDESVQTGKEGVRFMTIHKAKGLEFRVVFVVGLVEGILPSRKGDLEEERRICFVGISRAKELLYLTHSLTYLGQPSRKSLFIDEIKGS